MKLRIVSYNTQSGFANGRIIHDFVPQAEVIAGFAPDVVALQEVAIRHPKGKPVDYPAEVAARLQMNYLFAEAMTLGENGHYGVAILSRFPLERICDIHLPVPAEIEPRVALVARVHAPTPFYMVSTHLSFQGEFEGDDEGRVRQIQTILQILEERRLAPVILAGDLNAAPQAAAIEALRQRLSVLNDGRSDRPTALTSKYGWVQIDYIAASRDIQCREFRFGDDCQASDHYPAFAEVELP